VNLRQGSQKCNARETAELFLMNRYRAFNLILPAHKHAGSDTHKSIRLKCELYDVLRKLRRVLGGRGDDAFPTRFLCELGRQAASEASVGGVAPQPVDRCARPA
jgi:hypothetical protein